MFQPRISVAHEPDSYAGEAVIALDKSARPGAKAANALISGIARRWNRALRRRKIGRAYDMAIELAPVIPPDSRVLDVGCGNGYIAHHLSAILGQSVMGIDVDPTTQAAIAYRQFDGLHFPVADESVNVVLLCYVLHHAQDLDVVITEVRRVLSAGGYAVIYEDIPATRWDRLFCNLHNMKWRKRTGGCTFRSEREWETVFHSAGFEIIIERRLSRWRNLVHPVCRTFYLMRVKEAASHQG